MRLIDGNTICFVKLKLNKCAVKWCNLKKGGGILHHICLFVFFHEANCIWPIKVGVFCE